MNIENSIICLLILVFLCLQNKVLPDGSKQIEANELTFKNVDRHHSGTYVCTANNGYGMNIKIFGFNMEFVQKTKKSTK